VPPKSGGRLECSCEEGLTPPHSIEADNVWVKNCRSRGGDSTKSIVPLVVMQKVLESLQGCENRW